MKKLLSALLLGTAACQQNDQSLFEQGSATIQVVPNFSKHNQRVLDKLLEDKTFAQYYDKIGRPTIEHYDFKGYALLEYDIPDAKAPEYGGTIWLNSRAKLSEKRMRTALMEQFGVYYGLYIKKAEE